MMAESYYRTGQAAKQLGVSSYHVRRLCEAGEIAAEISAGQQWKIPAAEIARLKEEGIPPVPVRVREEAEEEPVINEAEDDPPSLVTEAAEDVKITASRLQKRRLEREAEEVEDWFRARTRRHSEEQAADRQRAEAALQEQRRRQWVHQWTAFALNALPQGTPRDVETDVHSSVQQALAGLQLSEPAAITQRLVLAAVEKALRPWRRKQEIERALEAGMEKLAWEVRYGAEHAGLKQRAWEAAVSAVRKAREDAGYSELAEATTQAVQPMVREYEHQQACKRALSWTWISGATSDEQDAAKEAARKALAVLPVGAAQRQLEQAKEAALRPFVAAVAQRQQAEREASEERGRQRSAEWKADVELGHIARHLQQEYEFDGGYAEMRREADRLHPLIREALIEELLENPDMSTEEIRESIEALIEDEL